MTKNRIAKIAALTVGMTFALSLSVNTAGAQSIAELQAQINALMAQLAALQGGVPTGTAVQFNMNLTVGSRGADVTSLQQFLVSKGFLQMPAGVAYGYFGPLTRGAVARWQAANGITPAVGYFGPISRARIATQIGTGVPTGPVTCPVGFTCAPIGGGVITTPGVEGTITATLNSTPVGIKLREGATRVAVAGIEIEAKTSDMRVERLKLDLDESGGVNTDQEFYNKIASKIYVMDGSTILASMDLNSSTVVEDGTDRFITIAGFNFVVPKDTKKVLTIALDARSSWDAEFDGDTWTIGVPVDGVRAVDGAGINQFSPTTAFTRSFTSEGDLVDDASLKISLNTGTPNVSEVIAAGGSDEDELDGLELLRFDVKAEDDSVEITDLEVTVTHTGAATTTTFYLMEGSTVIGSESGNVGTGNDVVFDNIDYVVPEGSTKTLTIKADIADAGAAASTFKVVVSSGANVSAENSVGDNVVETGSATGNTITVRNIGLEVTLLSKSITKSATTPQNDISTSTAEATFNLRIKAVGGDILIGTNASTTGGFVSNDGNGASATPRSFAVYLNGAETALLTNASSTNFTIPTSGTTANGTETRLLSEGASIDIPVSFLFLGRNANGVLLTIGSYAVGLERLNWVSTGGMQGSTFMTGELDWRTTTVSMP